MPDLRLADLLAALSVTDLAMGQSRELAIRACVVATAIARSMGLPEAEVSVVYYTTLLKHLGCTATSHEETQLFGPDEMAMRRVAERVDVTSQREALGFLRVAGKGAGAGRVRHVVKAVTGGKETNRAITEAVCEVAALMADRLQLGEGVRRALSENVERWDGKGGPRGLRADDIALAARIAEPARQAVLSMRPRARRPRSRWSASDPEAGSIRRSQRPSLWWALTSSGASKPGIRGPRSLPRNPSRSGGSRMTGSSRSPERSLTSSTSRRRSRWATRPRWPRSRRRRQRGSDFRTLSGSCSQVSCTTSAGPA